METQKMSAFSNGFLRRGHGLIIYAQKSYYINLVSYFQEYIA